MANKRRKEYVEFKCINCFRLFEVTPSQKNARLCCKKCVGEHYSKLYKNKKRPKYIGRKISKSLMGKKLTLKHRIALSKSHIKNDSVYGLIKRLRHNIKYIEWRKKIFERDNYKCIWGGKEHGNKLQADHIKRLSDIIKEFGVKIKRVPSLVDVLKYNKIWDIDNGRTLCIECHKQTDTYAGKKLKIIIYE